jgi:hypothetical protein
MIDPECFRDLSCLYPVFPPSRNDKRRNDVIDPKIPLFGKEGIEEILRLYMKTFILKIPLFPPFPKGDEWYFILLFCEPNGLYRFPRKLSGESSISENLKQLLRSLKINIIDLQRV